MRRSSARGVRRGLRRGRQERSLQPGLALSHEPAPPAMGRLAGHSHLRSDMGDRPA